MLHFYSCSNIRSFNAVLVGLNIQMLTCKLTIKPIEFELIYFFIFYMKNTFYSLFVFLMSPKLRHCSFQFFFFFASSVIFWDSINFSFQYISTFPQQMCELEMLTVPYWCIERGQHKESRVCSLNLASQQYSFTQYALPLGYPGQMKQVSQLIAPV